MEKVEEYIEKYTKRCSNLAHYEDDNGNVWKEEEPWLTPDHARKVAEIAREETINEMYEYFSKNLRASHDNNRKILERT